MRNLATEFEVSVAASHSARGPFFEAQTADFVYIRLHGPRALYGSRYSEEELAEWARRVEDWHDHAGKRQDVYVFFDNDGHAYAPRNALQLQEMLSSRQETSE